MRQKLKLIVTLALLASASLQYPLQAALIAYEGFDYTASSVITTATGRLEARRASQGQPDVTLNASPAPHR